MPTPPEPEKQPKKRVASVPHSLRVSYEEHRAEAAAKSRSRSEKGRDIAEGVEISQQRPPSVKFSQDK